MITVHMIGNAHLDPVWLWRWPAGVGEALGTCRTACDLLDEFPRFIFTRPDQWVHERIEELDPTLFQRVRAHAASGRWAVVGGWYIQPDCNFPLEESFHAHMDMGRRYFEEKLGVSVSVGYNVDSFGHAGSLPRLLAEHGYDSYVMMRPGAREKNLPASLFRWRSTAEAGGEREVIAWRITPDGYNSNKVTDLTEKVLTTIQAAVPGVDHVMCFYGVGDHGGGPTRAQIRWIMEHQDAIPGARLVFSHPRAFFDAVKPCAEKLPIVAGELQFHAIGCYSVERRLKQAVRAAEHGLAMARQAVEAFPEDAPAGAAANMEGAWKKTLFNQFHDIYGGTSIPAASEDSLAQLGAARECADAIVHSTLFRHAAGLPPCADQRIWVFNASDEPFDGCIRWEPWMNWGTFPGGLADQAGNPVPVQVVSPASAAGLWGSLVWPASLAPRALVPFSIRAEATPAAATDLTTGKGVISNSHWELRAGRGSSLASLAARGGARSPLGAGGITVRVFDDPSDTWSHTIDRYAGKRLGDFTVKAVILEESGPVRASLRVEAAFGSSRLSLWVRLYDADPRVEMEMRLDWHEKMRIAKLLLPFSEAVTQRLDGASGGGAVRPQDGREYPLIDWTQARLTSGTSLGISCPDCMSLDGEKDLIRFTLARSPVFSWHDPFKLSADRAYQYTDQGEHLLRFTLLPGADARALARMSRAAHRPPVCFDWTRGM